MAHGRIVRNYVRFWLWLDVFATIPWDIVFSATNDGASFLRFAKTSKAMRRLRCLKLLRAVRLVSQMNKANA
eukprot:2103815-Heterocapsa_arctica.AAC.1